MRPGERACSADSPDPQPMRPHSGSQLPPRMVRCMALPAAGRVPNCAACSHPLPVACRQESRSKSAATWRAAAAWAWCVGCDAAGCAPPAVVWRPACNPRSTAPSCRGINGRMLTSLACAPPAPPAVHQHVQAPHAALLHRGARRGAWPRRVQMPQPHAPQGAQPALSGHSGPRAMLAPGLHVPATHLPCPACPLPRPALMQTFGLPLTMDPNFEDL